MEPEENPLFPNQDSPVEIADDVAVGTPPSLSTIKQRSAIEAKSRKHERTRYNIATNIGRLALVAVFIAIWAWVPKIPGLAAHFKFFNPFFISTPGAVATEIINLMTGRHHTDFVWPQLASTVIAALIGGGLAILIGSFVGLLMSHYRVLDSLIRPFAAGVNAIPKVAIIPIVVIMFGASHTSDVINAFFATFFLVFFNALRGGASVPGEVIENMRILGAGSQSVLWTVRLPYVAAWIFAQLPNVVTFSLVATVTAQLLTGSQGLGQLLITALDTQNAALTFALVVILMVFGSGLVMCVQVIERRVFRWTSAVQR